MTVTVVTVVKADMAAVTLATTTLAIGRWENAYYGGLA
jgi:hypothetical protein